MSTNPEIEQIQQAINQTQVEAELAAGDNQEIRLETGEVYRGSPAQIQEALMKSKVEASKTIKARNDELSDLKERLRTLEAKQAPAAPPTDMEEQNRQYYETWAKDPSKATVMALAQQMGVDPDEYVRVTRSNLESSTINNASSEFTRRRPDFPNDNDAAAVLKRFLPGVLQRQGVRSPAALTADHLELAYQDAIRAGEIVPQSPPIAAALGTGNPMPNLRGISAPPSAETQVLSAAATMPLDQLEATIKRLRMLQG